MRGATAPGRPGPRPAPGPPLRVVHGGRGRGGSPGRIVENGVLGMALFLGTETMLFAGLVSALLVLRSTVPEWPPPGQPRLPVVVTGLNTLVLLGSGWTMRRSLRAAADGAAGRSLRLLAGTVALGCVFLAVQGSEWARLVRFGLTLRSGPYGAIFYTLIGCHALHVLAAVVAIGAVQLRLRGEARAGRFRRLTPLRVAAMYWWFVVGVWPILYVLVYWLPAR